jgi:hypothetical protein
MTKLHFYANSISDPSFEAYLRDTHRYLDYRDVRDELLPKLFESIEQFSKGVNFRFTCSNRFGGQEPELCIQSPVGFVPDVIHIEFPPRHEFFCVKHANQDTKVQGLENLAAHLHVLLVMGLAHWQPT